MAAKVEAAVINAVYKVNLHCHECACEIKRPLLRTEGVHQVEFDLEKNEVKVKGSIDAVVIHKRIERLSKRKVELISPKKVAVKEASVVATEKKVVAKETKEVAARTIQVKAYMHCDQCERDLRTKLLRHRGIFSVKTDMKAQRLTVQGSIENEKLLRYIQKRVNKRAEIITPPIDPKVVVEKKKIKELETTKKVEIKTATSDIVEQETKKKVVEVKTVEGNPYFIHYVYAPQIFSDENPNACSVM